MAKRRYSDEERASALVAVALNGGNVYRTSAELGIPEVTLRQWVNGDRHPEASQMSDGKKRELVVRLEEAVNQILDGLGAKVGEACLKDASISLGILVDKIQLLKGEPTAIQRQEGSISARIEKYSASLVAIAGAPEETGPDAGYLTGHGAGERLDTRLGEGETDREAGPVPGDRS